MNVRTDLVTRLRSHAEDVWSDYRDDDLLIEAADALDANAQDREAMLLALKALYMSSPHTDAKFRWKDPEWTQQRSEAIQALERQLYPPDPP